MNRSVAVALLLSLGVGLGVAIALMSPDPRQRQTIEWLDNSRSLMSFSLESEAGVFDNQSLFGRWNIVLFGFLHCPDICPTSLSQLATLATDLSEKSIDEKVAFVFVSVDPGRDSIVELGEYVRHFNPAFRGVTGSDDQLSQFAKDLGVQFKVSPDNEDYQVAHSTTFSIIDPEGVFRGRFRLGFDVTSLIRNFESKLN